MRTFAGGDHTDPLRPFVRNLREAKTFEEKAAALAAYASEHEARGIRISHFYCTHPDTASAKKKCRAQRAAELFDKPPRSSHADCDHPHTAAARRKCRQGRR